MRNLTLAMLFIAAAVGAYAYTQSLPIAAAIWVAGLLLATTKSKEGNKIKRKARMIGQIAWNCTNCGAPLMAPKSRSGQTGECHSCGQPERVP